MTRRGRPSIDDKRDNQYRVRLNDDEDSMLTHCSESTGKPKSLIIREALVSYFNTVQLNEWRQQAVDLNDTMMDIGRINMKRIIKCPHCGYQNMVDLGEFEVSTSAEERPMGSSLMHTYEAEDFECSGCRKAISIHGYISEYPLGAFEHEEIEVQ